MYPDYILNTKLFTKDNLRTTQFKFKNIMQG